MHEQITQTLQQVEREFGCRILFACESGSRAWGLASPNSDFDIRFIYTHPPEWYLDIGQPPDSIDAMLPGDLDLSGWELRKTLRLFAGCNPALYEWLNSPVVYRSDERFHHSLKTLTAKFFKPKSAGFHYLGMARKTLEAHPLNSSMQAKKLFYILRPLLALLWIAKQRSMPPTEFNALLNGGLAPDAVIEQIQTLQAIKHKLTEADRIEVEAPLLAWIGDTLRQAESLAETLPVHGSKDTAALNAIMREWVLYNSAS